MHPSRSVLEVLTRRLLVAHGLDGFVREFPIVDGGQTYRYDFAFPEARVILGFRVVFATWATVTERPERLVRELRATMAGEARPA